MRLSYSVPQNNCTKNCTMASIQKRGRKWRVFVLIDGDRDSRTFATKRECIEWANQQETHGILARHTVYDAVQRYRSVAEGHKGYQAELSRLKSIEASGIGETDLERLTPARITEWRDLRLKEVAPVSVRREMIILGAMFKIARMEWGWLRHNPMEGVKKPPTSIPRSRGITQPEIDQISANLLKMRIGAQVLAMFLLSLETGMRLSEMLGLRWADVHDKFVTIRESKNADSRDVPLSPLARQVIAGRREVDPDAVFTLSAHVVSKTFARASINGVHFHDARSEAITRLSKKLDVLQLAKMIGHRDIKSLMFYFSESADSVADRL